MKIKKMSDNAVNVYLTNSELAIYDINPEEAASSSADLHRFLYDVMEEVRNETDFDPYNGGQVVVEASRFEFGMVLEISKIIPKTKERTKLTREQFKKVKRVRVAKTVTIEKNKTEIEKNKTDMYDKIYALQRLADLLDVAVERHLGSKDQKPQKAQKPQKTKKTILHVFMFDSFLSMESALALVPHKLTNGGALYRKNKKYCLILNIPEGDALYNTLTEFAESWSAVPSAAYHIKESWIPVAHAVELTRMADSLRKMQSCEG